MSVHAQHGFGTLGKIARGKLKTNNDIKIIIQGANSQTGIGKTTLAVKLCRFIDPNWSAEEKSFVDVREYLNYCLECDKGSAVLMDEIEKGGDSRRAMSQENVDLSQGWATLRARNIAHIATLPSISMLDQRLLELCDYWILVKRRGVAQPFKVKVNDFTGRVQRKPLPNEEHIQFGDLSGDDDDKAYLDQIKDEMLMEDGVNTMPKAEHRKKMEKAEKEKRKEVRNQAVQQIYNHPDCDVSTTQLADEFDFVDVSQSQVYQILNS